MDKKTIIASLNNIANVLDDSGLFTQATSITNIMKRLAKEDKYEFFYVDKIKDNSSGKDAFKVSVTNDRSKNPIPRGPSFETEEKATQYGKEIAYKKVPSKKTITPEDDEKSKKIIEETKKKIKERLMKNE